MAKLVQRFNDISESLAYVSNAANIEAARKALDETIAKARDGGTRSKAIKEKRLLTPENIARQSGVYQDPEFLRRLASLLEWGYGEPLQLQVPVELRDGGRLLVSGVLNRACLREADAMLVQKYARRTDRVVTLVGVVSQAGDAPVRAEPEVSSGHMKEALATMVSNFADIEQIFIGRLQDEVVIDPVAAYVEVDVPEVEAADG